MCASLYIPTFSGSDTLISISDESKSSSSSSIFYNGNKTSLKGQTQSGMCIQKENPESTDVNHNLGNHNLYMGTERAGVVT